MQGYLMLGLEGTQSLVMRLLMVADYVALQIADLPYTVVYHNCGCRKIYRVLTRAILIRYYQFYERVVADAGATEEG